LASVQVTYNISFFLFYQKREKEREKRREEKGDKNECKDYA
jgi:hypothetical protein